MLIGDSLLSGIDSHKLIKTKVEYTKGAKIADVVQDLTNANDQYGSIIVCIESNDCAQEKPPMEELSDTMKQVIKKSIEMVQNKEDVIISSIPPRTDKEHYQQNIDLLNGLLLSHAEEEGITFINNDTTFKLSDGSPNDGYLMNDGVLLTESGTNRLAKNLKLKCITSTNGMYIKQYELSQLKLNNIERNICRDTHNHTTNVGIAVKIIILPEIVDMAKEFLATTVDI